MSSTLEIKNFFSSTCIQFFYHNALHIKNERKSKQAHIPYAPPLLYNDTHIMNGKICIKYTNNKIKGITCKRHTSMQIDSLNN